MPNITISGLPFATLPLDGPNSFFEVQTVEAGVTVSRKVAADDINLSSAIVVEDEGTPLAGGASTLNFVGAGVTASGAGSTKTITIPGGSTVNPGTVEGQMLRWDNTGMDYDPFSELIADLIGFELVSQLTYVAEAGIAIRNANGDVFIDNNLLGGGQYQYSVNLGNDVIRIRDDGLALFGMSGGTQNTTLQSGAEVDIVRNGVDQIALSLAPAAGGLSVNNTLTGAGLERVLTLSDLASGGQVDSVVGGTNISVNAADPVNPIVNLDAAITGMTVNGVVLNTGGAATNYLDETGAYSVPPSGGTPGGADTNVQYNNAGAFGGDANFTWDLTNRILRFDKTGTGANPVIRVNNVPPGGVCFSVGGSGSGSTNWLIWQSVDNGGANYWGLRDDHGLSAPNHRLEWIHNTLSPPYIVLDASGEMTLGGDQNQGSLQITGMGSTHKMICLDTGNGGLYMEEQANQGAFVAGDGQFWVRNDAPNKPMFTDDAGTDFDLTQGAFDTAANYVMSGSWEFTNALGVEFGPSCELDLRNSADNSTTFIQNLGPTLQFGIAGGDFGSGIFEIAQSSFAHVSCPVLQIGEQAAAETNIAGDGQVWVRSTAPNNLYFTDDTGEDFPVGYAKARQNSNATFNFNTANNVAPNRVLFYDDSNNYTVTTEDSGSTTNWEVGTAIQILAPTSGTITIVEGSGTTLFEADGTDTVGGGTLTAGVITIYRASATDYYEWGSGFTP